MIRGSRRVMKQQAPRWSRKLVFPAVSAGLVGALLAGGCQPSKPAPATQPTMSMPTAADYTARSSDVAQKAMEFQILASQMVLTNPSQNRPIVKQVFVSLADMLPKLAGPAPSGVFVHQFQVVAQVRDTVNTQAATQPVSGGVVDAG